MPRAIRSTKLDTRSARAKLPPRREPYWHVIAPGHALGYRKGKKSGCWIARLQETKIGRKYHRSLGYADDALEADGTAVLSFTQALERARGWFKGKAQAIALGLTSDDAKALEDYTVADALDDYLDWYKSHRKGYLQTKAAIETHIRLELGQERLQGLTSNKIRSWLERLAKAPPKGRTGKPMKREAPIDGRARKATANRILTILKAALNRAFGEGRAETDIAWRRIKPYAQVDQPVVRYLTQEEIQRLLPACQEDFRLLVQGALLAGCRLGELLRMTVDDFDHNAQAVVVREAKGGKPRHVYLTEEGTKFFRGLVETRREQVEAITQAPEAPFQLFLKTNGKPWQRSEHHRYMRRACKAAGIVPAVSFHILRHTYASHLAMGDVDLPVIAHNLGHADTRMTTRHYAHLAPSFIAEKIRESGLYVGFIVPVHEAI